MVWTDVAVGKYHTCALNAQNVAYCWGSNLHGQVGSGAASTAMVTAPVPVQGTSRFRAIYAGVTHTCGISTASQVYCWGSNLLNQIGDGTATDRPGPTLVQGLPPIRRLALEIGTTLAEAENGSLYCWGMGCFTAHEVGAAPQPVQVTVLPALSGVEGGESHACAVRTAGGVVCWGRANHGALGAAGAGSGWNAEQVSFLAGTSFQAVAVGTDHGCALAQGGALYCWGDNRHGQLGVGAQDQVESGHLPAQVPGAPAFAKIYAGGLVTCGITAAQDAYCWGHNQYGQLGEATNATRAAPTLVVGGHKFAALSTGGFASAGVGYAQHTCGITVAGRLYCWGYNGTGGLAAGSSVLFSSTPREVADPA